MSPLDEHLRGALASRTRAIEPSPDLLSGVERRAQRMRRQKVVAGVAASAVAVAALALGGPLVVSSLTGPAPGPVDQATSAPTPTPTPSPPPSPDTDRFALDPASPWAYRGVPLEQLGNGLVEAVRVQYAAVHGVGVEDVALSPLYGQRGATAEEAELFFVAEIGDAASWGVARTTEGGPEVVQDQPLAARTTALPAALPAESVSRLVVVAAEATDVQYCSGGPATCQSMGAGDGLGQTILDGDTSADAFRVVAPDGTVVAEGPAPDGETPAGEPEGEVAAPEDEEPAPDAPPGTPSNAVLWPVRGTASGELVEEALRAFARDTGTTRERVDGRLLYGSDRDGRNLLLLSAWQLGQDARIYGYLEAAGSGSGFLSGTTAPGPAALAVLVPAEAVYEDADWLLVVPPPSTGQVLYSPTGTGEPAPVADQGTEAAVVIERAPGASGDRLLVLDGDGDPDRPIYRGTVDELLAGMR